MSNKQDFEIKKDDNACDLCQIEGESQKNSSQPVDMIAKEETRGEGSDDNNSGKFNMLIFAFALVIVVVELILSFFGVSFETKLAVEGTSSVLAVLMSIGIIKSTKKATLQELKTEIEDKILKNKEEISKDIEQISKNANEIAKKIKQK